MAAPRTVMHSASQGGTRPPCSGRSAWPERFTGLSRQGRHERFEKFVRRAESALVLFGEIVMRIVGGIVELVFILDIHRALITGFGEHREEPLPIHRSVARDAEPPPARIVHGLD